MKDIPETLQQYLGSYGECLFDSWCDEPIAWGYPIVGRFGDDLWQIAGQYGNLECVNGSYGSKWFLITRYLTPKEAEEKYGPVNNIDIGPRGGFRSVMYGAKKFSSHHMDPRKIV